jgi:hypothetical protein
LILWYERATQEQGYERMLDLRISLAPHTKDPDSSVRDLCQMLQKMTHPNNV